MHGHLNIRNTIKAIGLLACKAVLLGKWFLMFQKTTSPSTSGVQDPWRCTLNSVLHHRTALHHRTLQPFNTLLWKPQILQQASLHIHVTGICHTQSCAVLPLPVTVTHWTYQFNNQLLVSGIIQFESQSKSHWGLFLVLPVEWCDYKFQNIWHILCHLSHFIFIFIFRTDAIFEVYKLSLNNLQMIPRYEVLTAMLL